ncbi:TetR family transcriptional regulator [Saccharibacillus sp. JS10]|uniref:TetR family transcriptional regulator n=1 Tax=Saccharibacillus sp. JS10 TaxID=2950552 RepID=UPI00210C8959|nr:TetR family transcriptional regulator [Saccharibacillus sp. JS10]MCQ4088473.1 TetR family transcriptional regulator [Saccharibacillus sp. JS10]
MSKEAEHVKIRIVKAAKKLMATKGFESTTVRDICAEAGANVSLVSYYYGGKEHVFEALLDAFIPINQVSEILSRLKLDPVEGICTLVREIVLFRDSDPDISRIIHQEMVRQTPRTTLVQQRIIPAWVLIRGFLEEGRQRGEFHFRSLDMTIVQLLGSVLFSDNRSGLMPIMLETFPDIDTQVADVLAFVLGGVGYRGELKFACEAIIPGLVTPSCPAERKDHEQ